MRYWRLMSVTGCVLAAVALFLFWFVLPVELGSPTEKEGRQTERVEEREGDGPSRESASQGLKEPENIGSDVDGGLTRRERAQQLIVAWDGAVTKGDEPLVKAVSEALVALGEVAIVEFVRYIRDLAGGQIEEIQSKRTRLAAALRVLERMDAIRVQTAIIDNLDSLRPLGGTWLFGAEDLYKDKVENKPFAIQESAGIIPAEISLIHSLLWVEKQTEELSLGNVLEFIRDTQSEGQPGEESFREPWISEIASRLADSGSLNNAEVRNKLLSLGARRSERLQAQLKWLVDATASLQDLLIFLQSADPNAFSRAIRAFVDRDENWRYIPDLLSSVLAMKGWQRALGVVSDVSSARWYQRGDGSDDKRVGRFAEALSRFSPGSEEHSLMREALSWVAIYSMLLTKGSKMTFGRDEIETPLRALSQRGNFNATFSFAEQVNNVTYNSENRPSGQAQWVLIVESATSAGDGARKLLEWIRTAPKTDLWSALDNGYDLAIFVTYNRSDFYAESPDSGDIRAFVERLLQEMAKIDPSSFVEVHIPDAFDAISEMIVGTEIDLSSEAKLSLVQLFKLYDNWKKRSGTKLDAQRARQFERIERLRSWLAK